RLHLEPAEHVFVDFGAGIGRVVILAATCPFRRVVGVEHSTELARIALQNIERSRRKLKCRNVQITVCDAASYAVPPDASIFSLKHPLQVQVLEARLDSIRAMTVPAEGPILIVCNLPAVSAFEYQILKHALLNLNTEFPLAELRRCLVFETRPSQT